MTHAYSKSYLSNAKNRLAQFFDYAINDCGFKEFEEILAGYYIQYYTL